MTQTDPFAAVKAAFDRSSPLGLVVIGVNFDPTADLVRARVKKGEILWPQLLDLSPKTRPPWFEYGIPHLPAIWLFDQEGLLVDHNGAADLMQKLEALMGTP